MVQHHTSKASNLADARRQRDSSSGHGGCHPAEPVRGSAKRGTTFRVAGLLIGGALVVASGGGYANDITVHPAACVAPFLDQAFPMRWHEHFLMNPSSGTRTFVICPLTYDNDVVDWTTPINIRVTGGVSSDASLADVPQCFFTVADRINLNQPPYINGPDRTYLQGLGTTTNNPVPNVWQASGNSTISAMRSSIGTDPGLSNAGAMNEWSSAVFCRLPPGYSVTNIFIGQ